MFGCRSIFAAEVPVRGPNRKTMNETTKMKIVAAAFLAAAVIAAAGWAASAIQIERAQQRLSAARAATAAAEREAAARELEAAQYTKLIEQLEQKIAGIRSANTKLDEKLKDKKTTTRNARADVERARGHRPVGAVPAAESVCEKLAALGHPC